MLLPQQQQLAVQFFKVVVMEQSSLLSFLLSPVNVLMEWEHLHGQLILSTAMRISP